MVSYQHPRIHRLHIHLQRRVHGPQTQQSPVQGQRHRVHVHSVLARIFDLL